MRFLRKAYSKRQQERFLLNHVLKSVSRSFYLSLFILPQKIRKQVSLAYLFCRIADTIADTSLFPSPQRLHALEIFRRQFLLESPSSIDIATLEASIMPQADIQPGEQKLCDHLSDCFSLYTGLPTFDRQLISELVLTLTQGMRMDLLHFRGEPAAVLQAFPNFATLELYTYYVAGAVGEFWTKLHTTHLYPWPTEQHRHLCALGIHFGKGLQMTNILKDLGKDLAHGRCYLPEVQLEHLGVPLAELLQPGALSRICPVLLQLMLYTLYHLDQAYQYVLLLPPSALRSRLSCMWPLLFALKTLTVICQEEFLLDKETRVKISRSSVYSTIFLSFGCLVLPRIFRKYYFFLRKRLVTTLHTHYNSHTSSSTPLSHKE